MNFSLNDFDGQLLDGLAFCTKAYAMFEEVRAAPNGATRLRMRPDRLERKLLDELLPICSYIQATYALGRYIAVRWVDGSQSYDAETVRTGYYVEQGIFPATGFLEVTCVVHPNEYLSRELLETKGGGFGLDGLRRLKSREIESVPVSYSGIDFVESFSKIALKEIEKKATKIYPENTVLIVQCTLNNIYTPNEWAHLVALVDHQLPEFRFRKIYFCDAQRRYSHTFYGRTIV